MELHKESCSFCSELQREYTKALTTHRELVKRQDRIANVDLNQYLAMEKDIIAVGAWRDAARVAIETHLTYDHKRKKTAVRSVIHRSQRRPVAA